MKLKTPYLIAAQGLIFILFLIATAWFNRFSSDDFYFIGELHTKSFSEVYHHLYFNWHGRWTSNVSELISFKFYDTPYILFTYNLLTFTFVTSGIHQLFSVLNTKHNLLFTKKQLFSYSLIFLSTLFFCSFTASSTWFWHTSTVVYLWGIAAFLWCISRIISNTKSVPDYFILIITEIYFGGAYEPLAMISLLLLSYIFFKDRTNKKALLGFIFILTALLIDYFSSGTKFRDGITPSLSFIDFILYTGYGTLKLLFLTCYKTILPAVFLSIPFYYLGSTTKSFHYNFNLKKEALISILIIGFVATINQAIVIFALGGLAPNRSTLITSLTIAILIVRYFFLLGVYHKNNPKNVKAFLTINCLGLIIFTGITSFYHYNYAKAYDERMNYIANQKEEIIKVKPLPFSGYIYSAEISADSNYFSNQHLRSGLRLKQQIILDEK
jgi:hypothetical protein